MCEEKERRYSIMVSMSVCLTEDRGSIPRVADSFVSR